MKTLVIGGNGFIGTNLTEALLEAGHTVHVFDRYPSRYKEPVSSIKYLVGDIGNHGAIEEAVADMDWVFHLAYTTLPQTSNDDPVYDVRSNVVDTVQLLQCCRNSKVKKIVFISSGGTIYGIPQNLPITENHPTEPMCSYGISKLAIEKYLHLFHKLWGLEYVVARISNPYGEHQNPYAQQGAIGVFLGNVVQGKPIVIWGDGSVVRDYLYVKDTAKALLMAAEFQPAADSNRIFNIGSGIGYSLNQIVDEIKAVVDMPVKVEYMPQRPVDVPANVLDISRANKELGWHIEVDLHEGIEKTWKWVKSIQEKQKANAGCP